jgi:hypothetical protein
MDKEIIYFLNILEGYKIRCKNLHWAADNINTHEYLDKFLDEISEFQDAIAEGYLGIKGKFNNDDIQGILIKADSAFELAFKLRGDLIYFYDGIPDLVLYKGLMSECENFIQVVNKYKYLFSLCNGREEVESFISRE